MRKARRTRFKDKNGEKICYGDIVHVEEYPDKYVGGSYDYEGVVEWDYNDKMVVVTYYDFSNFGESMPLCRFPVNGREIIMRTNREVEEEENAMHGKIMKAN